MLCEASRSPSARTLANVLVGLSQLVDRQTPLPAIAQAAYQQGAVSAHNALPLGFCRCRTAFVLVPFTLSPFNQLLDL